MRVLVALVLALTVVAAVPKNQQRIVGGTIATIANYPEIVSLLYSWGLNNHMHACGGTILNNRSILTAAHCVIDTTPANWRTRAGSANANSGGTLYNTASIINHAYYNIYNRDYDVSILRLASSVSFTASIQPATISGPNYFLADNQMVWVAGYGATVDGGAYSAQLRHVQIWTVNQNLCRVRYAELGNVVTDNMLCAGWLDVGYRGECQGDFGGPLYHNRVVVGVTSWSHGCGAPRFPGVSTRVSRFTSWIQTNA